MVHLPGVVHHHPEEALLLEEDLLLQGVIVLEVEIEIVVVLEEVEGTLEREEVLLLGGCLQEEDLLPEETLAEMMTAEEVLLAVRLLKVELGAAEVVTDLLLVEDLHPAEEAVTMAQLTGAVTALLPVMTLPHPNQDQPAKQKTQAGPLSSVSPRLTWDSPGFRDLLRLPGIVASCG